MPRQSDISSLETLKTGMINKFMLYGGRSVNLSRGETFYRHCQRLNLGTILTFGAFVAPRVVSNIVEFVVDKTSFAAQQTEITFCELSLPSRAIFPAEDLFFFLF